MRIPRAPRLRPPYTAPPPWTDWFLSAVAVAALVMATVAAITGGS